MIFSSENKAKFVFQEIKNCKMRNRNANSFLPLFSPQFANQHILRSIPLYQIRKFLRWACSQIANPQFFQTILQIADPLISYVCQFANRK